MFSLTLTVSPTSQHFPETSKANTVVHIFPQQHFSSSSPDKSTGPRPLLLTHAVLAYLTASSPPSMNIPATPKANTAMHTPPPIKLLLMVIVSRFLLYSGVHCGAVIWVHFYTRQTTASETRRNGGKSLLLRPSRGCQLSLHRLLSYCAPWREEEDGVGGYWGRRRESGRESKR